MNKLQKEAIESLIPIGPIYFICPSVYWQNFKVARREGKGSASESGIPKCTGQNLLKIKGSGQKAKNVVTGDNDKFFGWLRPHCTVLDSSICSLAHLYLSLYLYPTSLSFSSFKKPHIFQTGCQSTGFNQNQSGNWLEKDWKQLLRLLWRESHLSQFRR